MIDSGASFHLVKFDDLSKSEKLTVRRLPTPIRLLTANGIISVSTEAKVWVNDLSVFVWALVLKETACVLSMGKLVIDNGFRVRWDGHGQPMQLIKNGTLINCRLRHDVPWLYVGTQTPDSADPTPAKVQEPTSSVTSSPPPPSIPLPPPNWAKLKAGWHNINESTQVQVSLNVAAFRTPSPHLDTTEYRWRTTWSFDGKWHLLDRDCEYGILDNKHVFFGTVGKLITIFSKLDPTSGKSN